MAIRTSAQISRDMTAWLKSQLRVVDTGASAALYSLLLSAIVTRLGNLYAAAQVVETAQGISDPANTDPADLDDITYNLNLTRKPPSQATGFVTFRRSSAPTATIRIGDESGAGNVLVSTGRDSSGNTLNFITTATAFFTTATSKDPISGFYEVSAPITCVQSGAIGNQAAGAINTILAPITGVSSITNKTATTNGADQESNESLALRAVSKILGLQPGIIEGLRTIALSQAGVSNAAVVDPNDSEFYRSAIGAVDLVLKGQNLTTGSDLFTYTSPVTHVLDNRPVTGISTVVSMVGATQGALVPNVQWQFSQDTTSEQRYSVDSNDRLSWMGTNLPNSGAQVLVVYTYDKLIKDVQDIVDNANEHYPAAQVLVKRGIQTFVDIAFTVRRTSAIDSSTLQNNISTALTNYIDSLGIGASIAQSDLLRQIKAVNGVRQVILPFTTLAIRGNSGAADLALTKYQYPSLDDQSLAITVTT